MLVWAVAAARASIFTELANTRNGITLHWRRQTYLIWHEVRFLMALGSSGFVMEAFDSRVLVWVWMVIYHWNVGAY